MSRVTPLSHQAAQLAVLGFASRKPKFDSNGRFDDQKRLGATTAERAGRQPNWGQPAASATETTSSLYGVPLSLWGVRVTEIAKQTTHIGRSSDRRKLLVVDPEPLLGLAL